MRDMAERIDSNQQRQDTIISFLARLAQNPTVLQQMVSVADNLGLQRSLNDGRNGGEQGSRVRCWPTALGLMQQGCMREQFSVP